MKKTAQNDVTGDWLQSKPNNEQFEKNFDLIFGKKEKKEEPVHLNVEDHIIAVIPPMTDTALTHDQLIAKELNRINYEYELNPSTGEVQKKHD